MENVRMGELAVSGQPGDELVATGLGSCIALAVADTSAGIAGLAHVVLPESAGKPGPAGKFADQAVPAMVAEMIAVGADQGRLEAVLIGGARMFDIGAGFDIGARNAEAVRIALADAQIPIRAEDVGGNHGRTARVVVGGDVSSQSAGGTRAALLSADRGSAPTTISSQAIPTGAFDE
jgi:chemotaxis protein CheD